MLRERGEEKKGYGARGSVVVEGKTKVDVDFGRRRSSVGEGSKRGSEYIDFEVCVH